jgi:hypothetical protein
LSILQDTLMMTHRFKKSQKGFGIIEAVIALAILGAAIVVVMQTNIFQSQSLRTDRIVEKAAEVCNSIFEDITAIYNADYDAFAEVSVVSLPSTTEIVIEGHESDLGPDDRFVIQGTSTMMSVQSFDSGTSTITTNEAIPSGVNTGALIKMLSFSESSIDQFRCLNSDGDITGDFIDLTEDNINTVTVFNTACDNEARTQWSSWRNSLNTLLGDYDNDDIRSFEFACSEDADGACQTTTAFRTVNCNIGTNDNTQVYTKTFNSAIGSNFLTAGLVAPEGLSRPECNGGGVQNLDITVQFNSPVANNTNIPFTFSHVTTNNADFDSIPTSPLVLSAGQQIATLSVPVNCDCTIEDDEVFQISFADSSNYEFSNSQNLEITLSNDDGGSVRIATTDFTIAEGDCGDTATSFTVETLTPDLTPNTCHDGIDITLEVDDDSTVNSTDHSWADTFTCTIPIGASSATCSGDILGDELDENDETLTFNITNTSDGLTVGDDSLTITIDDDDSCTGTGEQVQLQVRRGSDRFNVVSSVINISENPTVHYNWNGVIDNSMRNHSSIERQEYAHHDAVTFFVTKYTGPTVTQNLDASTDLNINYEFEQNSYSLWFIFDHYQNNCKAKTFNKERFRWGNYNNKNNAINNGGFANQDAEGGSCKIEYDLMDMPTTSQIVVADDASESDITIDWTQANAVWSGNYRWNGAHDGVVIDFGLDLEELLALDEDPSFEITNIKGFDNNNGGTSGRRYVYRNSSAGDGTLTNYFADETNHQPTDIDTEWTVLTDCNGNVLSPSINDVVSLNISGTASCGPPTVEIDSATYSVTEGDANDTTVDFQVNIVDGFNNGFDIDYSITYGTATASDVVDSDTCSIPDGAVNAQCTVTIEGDYIDENNETFTISLTDQASYDLGDGITTTEITIIDEDQPPPEITFSSNFTDNFPSIDGTTMTNTNISEGNSGSQTVTFEISASHTDHGGFDVTLGLHGSSDANGTDVGLPTCTMAAETSTTSCTFTVNGDTDDEIDEDLHVMLVSSTFGTIGSANRLDFDLLDNDFSVRVSCDDQCQVWESNAGGDRIGDVLIDLSAQNSYYNVLSTDSFNLPGISGETRYFLIAARETNGQTTPTTFTIIADSDITGTDTPTADMSCGAAVDPTGGYTILGSGDTNERWDHPDGDYDIVRASVRISNPWTGSGGSHWGHDGWTTAGSAERTEVQNCFNFINSVATGDGGLNGTCGTNYSSTQHSNDTSGCRNYTLMQITIP